MKQRLRQLMTIGAVTVLGMVGLVAFQPTVQAQCNGSPKDCITEGAGTAQESDTSVEDASTNLVNTLLFVLGIVSVLAIILGGIRFATSNGSADQIKQAKNIILYAVVGLVVAILAYAIVDFVVKNV